MSWELFYAACLVPPPLEPELTPAQKLRLVFDFANRRGVFGSSSLRLWGTEDSPVSDDEIKELILEGFQLALKITRDEDLAQEAVLRAVFNICRSGTVPSDIRSYFFQTVRFSAVSQIRTAAAKRRICVQSSSLDFDVVVENCCCTDPLPSEQLEFRELHQGILEALHQLPTNQERVLSLHYLHGLEIDEIADKLNIPPGTVKSRLYHGRCELKRILEKDYTELLEAI